MLLGLMHLLYTLCSPKLLPRDRELQRRIQQVSPVITRQTTIWKPWVGFMPVRTSDTQGHTASRDVARAVGYDSAPGHSSIASVFRRPVVRPMEARDMVRGVFGIIVGAIVWSVGFYALVILLAALWPDFALHGRVWQREGAFSFTPRMACFLLLFWVLAEIATGWVAMKIAKRREAVWVLAGLLVIYLAALHIVLYWPRFPWWYNLGVVIPAVPALLLGGRLAGAFRSANGTVAAG
jgi:hypothetical protein